MSPAAASLRAIEACTFHISNWRPFQIHTKTLDSDLPKPYSILHTDSFINKRHCRADRATSFRLEVIDFSRLSLIDADEADRKPLRRKRRRRREHRSERRRRRCFSAGASAAGTDSSADRELCVNGDLNWALGLSEAIRNLYFNCALQNGSFESLGNESGYGSEPGYRGDVELGYDDDEDDDQRFLFWDHEFGASKRGKFGHENSQNTSRKVHHRCRQRKHGSEMVHPLR